jgi:hypothetical protein
MLIPSRNISIEIMLHFLITLLVQAIKLGEIPLDARESPNRRSLHISVFGKT